MSVEYTSQVGYGFLLEPLDKNEEVLEIMEAVFRNYEFSALSLELSGDWISGENMSVVAFVNDGSVVSFDKYDSSGSGAVPLDKVPMLTDAMIEDLEHIKEHFRVVNEEPIPIAVFAVS